MQEVICLLEIADLEKTEILYTNPINESTEGIGFYKEDIRKKTNYMRTKN